MAKLFAVRVGSFKNLSGVIPTEDRRIQRLVVIGRKRVWHQNRWQPEVRDLTQTGGSRASDDQICRSVHILPLVVEPSDKPRNSLLLISIVNELVIFPSGQFYKLPRPHFK